MSDENYAAGYISPFEEDKKRHLEYLHSRVAALEAELAEEEERKAGAMDAYDEAVKRAEAAEAELATLRDYISISSDPPCPDVCKPFRELDHRAEAAESEVERLREELRVAMWYCGSRDIPALKGKAEDRGPSGR